jgi:phosphoglycerate dehydrogenase-like enzyme
VSRQFNVVVFAPIMGRNLDPIRALEPQISVIDGNDAFEAYSRALQTQDRIAIDDAVTQLATMLSDADVLCMMYPALEQIVVHAPKLRWLHHTQAGVSNLWSSDVWNASNVTITSGRGHVRPTAIAEYCLAATLTFARGLHDGYADKAFGSLRRSRYEPLRIEGATIGVIGLGGIGREVARLARAFDMRVVATRRSAVYRGRDTEGVDLLLPPTELAELAAASDFVAVCTALTEETRGLIDEDFFAAATKRPVIVNISRGEVIEEDALLDALNADRLRGAVLDVYAGELERKPPRHDLMSHPKVLLTPHISSQGDHGDSAYMDLFCENLRRFLAGDTLLNVVDRARGY